MLLRKLRLRTLLTLLSVGGVFLTSTLLLVGLLLFQKSNIENSLLEDNIAYARKLADITDRYFETAANELAWSAAEIKGLNDQGLLVKETNRLRRQSGFFNTVVVVNRQAVIAATSPESLKLLGVKLSSLASQQAISIRKPFISQPYISAAGNYVVFVSHPIFNPDGDYLGYIGGTIYLKKKSMLSDILSQHFYSRNSVVSIVSNDGDIILSHDPTLVGTKMDLSAQLKKQLSTTDYGHFSIEKHGQELLTGYASLSQTNWNIFMSGTSETVSQILFRALRGSLWFLLAVNILTAVTVAVLAGRIASPLGKLADMVRSAGNDARLASVQSIQAWYHEADSLKKAVQEYRIIVAERIAKLSDEAMTDPLTRLNNRRGFEILAEKHNGEITQSVVTIDIDHFKRINDRFGHDAGDAVLVKLATLMRQTCRTRDLISRFGGEEFAILLPQTTLSDAARTAERIRKAVTDTRFPFAGQITVSAGVASLGAKSGSLDDMLRLADQALYVAKREGRNAVVIAGASGFRFFGDEKKIPDSVSPDSDA